ncbi:hypothetical protein ASPCAL06913 [Aspergillus calidoustus]|uniref:Uncharacterized protein n=1 Tax=Aspergillus calidoustus TaxID=454130 RepID=A0A0U5G290_ASPCI|nr:hypothetical protein ASPCAL06913 [Aspergillus calidoustus]
MTPTTVHHCESGNYQLLNAAKEDYTSTMPPAHNMAAQTSPPSRLDLLTRPNQALKHQQPWQVAELHTPPSEVAPHQEGSEKTSSETSDDPADENQEGENWETNSFGVYEASRPWTDAQKKWYCAERRLRRLENLLDKQISWNNEIQKKLAELRPESPTAEPASRKVTRAKRPRTSGTD